MVLRTFWASWRRGGGSGADSREKQKSFCRFAGEELRNIFLLQQGFRNWETYRPTSGFLTEDLAGRLRKKFSRQGLAALDRALLLLERNVIREILFAELADRLYMTVL